jgi:hypothetical protein
MKLPYWKQDPLEWIARTRSLPSEIRGPVMDIQCELWLAEKRGIKTMILGDWCRVLGILDPVKALSVLRRLKQENLLSIEMEQGGGDGGGRQTFFEVCNADVTQNVTLSVEWILGYGEKLDSTSERVKRFRERQKAVTQDVTRNVTGDVTGGVTQVKRESNAETLRLKDLKTLDFRQKKTTDIVSGSETSEGSTPAGYGDLVDHIRASYKAGPGRARSSPLAARKASRSKR